MNKTLLLALASACVLGAPSASAITAADVAAKGKVWIAFPIDYDVNDTHYTGVYSYVQGEVPVKLSSDGKYLEVPFTHYIFTDYYEMAELNPVLLLDISSKNIVTVANNFVASVPVRAGYDKSLDIDLCIDYDLTMIASSASTGYFYVLTPLDSYYGDTTGNIYGIISQDNEGNYTIELNPFDFYRLTAKSGSFQAFDVNLKYVGSYNGTYYHPGSSYYSFSGTMFKTYASNASVTDTEYLYDNSGKKTDPLTRNFTAEFNFKGDNTFTVNNWSNSGCPAEINKRGNDYYSDFTRYNGTYDVAAKTVMLNAATVAGDYDFTVNRNNYTYYLYKLMMSTDFTHSNNHQSPLTGTLDYKGAAHSTTNNWLDASGAYTYLKNVVLDFDDYFMTKVLYTNASSYTNTTYYTGIQVTIDDGVVPYTHSVTVKPNAYGHGTIAEDNPDTYIYLNCSLENSVNDEFVADYELYIVPGTYSSPNFATADFNSENGHVKATRIDFSHYITGFPYTEKESLRALDAEVGENNPFADRVYNLLIPENDLKAKDANGNYSLFVKTIYTPESGLAPTFQALTSIGSTTTGFDSIVSDNAQTDAPVEYYNMNGVRMAGDNLPAGMYIRRQGSSVSKVVIR